MRPVIGVTTSRYMLSERVDRDRVYLAFLTYTTMVRAAGGIPVSLTPGAAEEAPALLERLDGLLLAGGGDVDPDRYGATPHESVYGIDPARDEFEISLVREARDRRLPTLCICRGMQVLNVALGGTLIQDIAADGPGLIDHRRINEPAGTRQHTVDLDPGSSTARAIGADSVTVNSLHHQAIRDLAPGLIVTGRAPDGIIEAVASDDDWPMWAVQWHPESLGATDEPSARLFEHLVHAALESTAPANADTLS
ncbi:MAG TPA: gamma-glutamyl-gamma-aminobutyrate hydrolase family protein [Acidimicrobiia bacterium]|nr:gamma-glutamyl-gamma-aminobutyrate hydrolase family protein [Acidimicrobiia bacterium]